MKRNLGFKTLFILASLVVFLAGIFLGQPKDWGKNWATLRERGPIAALRDAINLGLDLRGGTHLILQVVVNDAVNADTERAVERTKEQLRANNIAYSEITKPDPANHPERILLRGVPPESTAELRRVITQNLPEYDLTSGAENAWNLVMKPTELSSLTSRAVTQAIESIRDRVDKLGVTEPVIQAHGLGEHQILVQLPGVDDPARVKEIMQSTAMLEIRQSLAGPYSSEQEARAAQPGFPDSVVMRGATVTSRREGASQEWYIISRSAPVSGRDIRDAVPSQDETGMPAVSFNLRGEAGRRFENFTSAHVGDNLAIILDNLVREVAVIREPIRDQVQISGAFTSEQVRDLSMMLRSGALPASIKYLEERTVGPSLGVDSIRDGVRAAVIGMFAVMVFMLIYYRGAGVNANLGLFLNLVILLGFLGFSGAVLTLPGIAGVILTVGMGVDSNVLIFERIREELRAGKSVPSAVEQGFSRAWLTILDTHVTTIVSAFILFIFGTGPVRGFAVTLTFGLLANLFTAVFVSRVIFDAILQRKQRGEALSI